MIKTINRGVNGIITTGVLSMLLFVNFTSGFAGDKQKNLLIVNADQGKVTINKNIYGHFAEHLGGCIYGGIWVGEDSDIPNTRGIRNDVVQALKKIDPPVVRWPGGCFADEYHWKDGIGPRKDRPEMVNTHWGKVTENNHFGTHEFLDFCKMIDTEPYICGNVGSGTVLEMQEWVEYITFDGKSPMADLRRKNGREKPWKVKYWGVGNENWGCGGNMRPEYYADLYRRYATYLRDFSGNELFKIACGPHGDYYKWTEVLMREATRQMDGYSLHYYVGTGALAIDIDQDSWFKTLKKVLFLDELLKKHITIMDQYDPEGRVELILDEWGAWHKVEPGTNPGFLYQQNTIRDAIGAAVSFNIMHNYADRLTMANIAQTINVLQSMILTDGPKMMVTPTYHVFEMYKVHQDAILLPIHLNTSLYQQNEQSIPAVSASASKNANGSVNVSICNLDPNNAIDLECLIRGAKVNASKGRVLTSKELNSHNSFENPDTVSPKTFDQIKKSKDGWNIKLPPKSVVVIEFK
jgi:alpha-N-arabinofuranosidase